MAPVWLERLYRHIHTRGAPHRTATFGGACSCMRAARDSAERERDAWAREKEALLRAGEEAREKTSEARERAETLQVDVHAVGSKW